MTGSPRPLRTTSREARAALVARAGHAWGAWCERFGLQAGGASCTASDGVPAARSQAAAARHIGADTWLFDEGGSPEDAVVCALFGRAALGTAPGPARGTGRETVAHRVANEALADLVAGLRAAFPPDDGTGGGADVDAAWATGSTRWSGAARIRLCAEAAEGAGDRVALELMLAVGPRTVASVVPSGDRTSRPATLRPALTPLWAALDAQPLRLEIRLDALELDLGVLQSLRPGDVLPLSHDLARPLHAHLPCGAAGDGPPPTTGPVHLGRRGDRRAVVPAAPFCIDPPSKVSS